MTAENRVGYQATLLQFIMSEEPSKNLQSRVRTLTEVERAWLAGVIDGEGSILISRIAPKKGHYRRGFYYRAALEISNSNPLFVKRVVELIGKGSAALTKEKCLAWKDKWQYQGSSFVLKAILPQVLPYLVVKRKVAEKMLEYLQFVDTNQIDGPMEIPEGFDERRDYLFEEIKRLNERGPNSTRQDETSEFQPPVTKARGRGIRVASCRNLTEPERAWLAAIIDGEGTITISKVKDIEYRRGFYYCPKLEISNTNKTVLDKVWQLVGAGGVYIAKREQSAWKKKWAYMASAGVMRAILPQIIPYLIIKRAQAERMWEYLKYIESNPILGLREIPPGYYERLDLVYVALKKLNEKGRGAGIF